MQCPRFCSWLILPLVACKFLCWLSIRLKRQNNNQYVSKVMITMITSCCNDVDKTIINMHNQGQNNTPQHFKLSGIHIIYSFVYIFCSLFRVLLTCLVFEHLYWPVVLRFDKLTFEEIKKHWENCVQYNVKTYCIHWCGLMRKLCNMY